MILQVTLVHTAHMVAQVVTVGMLIRHPQNQILEHVKHVAEKGMSCATAKKKLVFAAERGRLYRSLIIKVKENGGQPQLWLPPYV